MQKTILTALLLGGTAALAETPKVMTDIPAVHSLTAQVMKGVGEPGILLDKGSDPHSFQLRPSQARALSQADLVFWVGPEMTPWLGRAIEGVGITGTQLELLEAEPTLRRDFAEYGHDEEHGHDDHDEHAEHDEHGHDEHAGHDEHDEHDEHDDHDHDHDEGEEHAEDEHDHAHDGLDPHAWLDPENAKIWLGLIAAELSKADPDQAALYTANATAAQQHIDELSAEAAALLEPVHEKPFVVFHDAYGYFAARYDLHVAGAMQAGDAAAAGAARLSELRAEFEEEGVVCAFAEAQHDPAQLQVLAEGTGVKLGSLDPSGSSLDYGPGLYDALILGLAQNIATCLAD